ncbi:MAG: hypothetical protein ACYC0V_14660 [Armatimonadota bacterium]
MRKFLIIVILLLIFAHASSAAPSFQLLSSPTQVGRYEVFQSTFELNTVATNYYWPYETNPPASIPAGVGVTVEAIFTNSNTNTVITVPCFYYQDYDRKLIGSSSTDESVIPNGTPYWMVRFSPPELGSWHFQLKATDASGTTIYPSESGISFDCISSNNKGFVTVSPTDSRYFELSDKTPIASAGVNIRPGSTYDADRLMQSLGDNSVKIVRWLMSYRGSVNPFSGGDYAVKGGPQWEFSLNISTNGGSQPGDRYSVILVPGNSTYQRIYLDAGTEYRYTGYIKASGVSGSGIIPYIGNNQGTPVTGTTGWQTFTLSYTPSVSGIYEIGVKNDGSAGTGYFDNVSLVAKKPSDTDWSSNYLSKGDFEFQNYMDPKESWKVDHIFQAAKDNGVYLKTVISEKQETCLGSINSDGSTGERLDDNFYASNTHPSRWLQQTWWRYIIARWGAYSAVHSWELCNEGDPFNSNHYNAANALAAYMKANDPYKHLVTTSFWHSTPMNFWKTSLCDYINTNEYLGPVTPDTGSHGPRFYAWTDPISAATNEASAIPQFSAAGEVSLDAVNKHSGAKSLKLKAYASTTPSVITAGGPYHVGINPAHKYTLRFWVKGANVTAAQYWYPCINIVWSEAYHENDAVGVNYYNTSLGTFDWKLYQITGITPLAGSNTANIYINCTRGPSINGSMWFDDISFVDETTGEELFVGGGFEEDRLDYDTALAVKKLGVLVNSYGRRVGKPAVIGESGIRGLSNYGTEENHDLLLDTNGIFIKKIIWAHAGPEIPYMLMLWTECIETNDLWYYFKAYNNFMSNIMVSNGNFYDANAIVSNPGMRAWGQKNNVDGCAYLWIDNAAYTWKNIVNGNIPAPISGTVTIQGLNTGSYIVEWWNTSTGVIISRGTAESIDGNLVLNISDLVSDIACKVYTPSNILSDALKTDMLIKSGTESVYSGSDVYSTDGSSQTKSQDTIFYQKKVYAFRVKNAGIQNDSFKITGPAGGNGWSVKYYDLFTNVEITSDVTGSGWTSGTLAPGAIKGIYVNVRPDWSVLAASTNTLLIKAVSETDNTKVDVVKAVTNLIENYKTDMLIKTGAEDYYSGTHIFNTDAYNQTKILDVSVGQKVTCAFRAMNAGNTNDSFKITATAGGSDWVVRYLDLTTGADVTSQVTGSGWSTGTILPRISKGIYAQIIPESTVPVGSSITLIVNGTSDSDGSKVDVVKSVVTCVAGN